MVRAVFPGTFDPVHFGHIDIAERATRLFDEVIVAVYDKPLKTLLFSPSERIELVKRAFENQPKIKVVGYRGLTVELCHAVDAQVIVRGLRVFSDFEYEFHMASINRHLNNRFDTFFMMTAKDYFFVSSRTIKEVAMLGGSVKGLVPENVENALKSKFRALTR